MSSMRLPQWSWLLQPPRSLTPRLRSHFFLTCGFGLAVTCISNEMLSQRMKSPV